MQFGQPMPSAPKSPAASTPTMHWAEESWNTLQHLGERPALAEMHDRPRVGAGQFAESQIGIHNARMPDHRRHRNIRVAVGIPNTICECLHVGARPRENAAIF